MMATQARRPHIHCILCRFSIALSAAAILVACGGGGTIAGVGVGGTGAIVSGSISGFGSVIVNGVRFDDSAASVSIDDDAGKADDLRLGMLATIEGDADNSTATGKANAISTASFAQGPISAIDQSNKKLTVLGLVVSATNGTAFEGLSGFSDPLLKVGGDYVEIHGLPDGQGGLQATRIERKPLATEIRLVGAVANLNPDSSTKTFSLYGVTVQYPNAKLDQLPNGLSKDGLVRVKGTLSSGTIIASKIRSVTFAAKEGQHVELEGIVTNFNSSADFQIIGQKIDATKAITEGTLADGARVEVEGAIANGILVATKLQTKSADQEDVELHGAVSNLSGNTFSVGSVKVRWDNDNVFAAPLTAANLANGTKVEVKGSVSGDAVLATTIKQDS